MIVAFRDAAAAIMPVQGVCVTGVCLAGARLGLVSTKSLEPMVLKHVEPSGLTRLARELTSSVVVT